MRPWLLCALAALVSGLQAGCSHKNPPVQRSCPAPPQRLALGPAPLEATEVAISRDGSTVAVTSAAQRRVVVYDCDRNWQGMALAIPGVEGPPSPTRLEGLVAALDATGNTLAVGALGSTDCPGGSCPAQGTVVVYTRDGTSWTPEVLDTGDRQSAGFGSAVAVSDAGDLVAAAAPGLHRVVVHVRSADWRPVVVPAPTAQSSFGDGLTFAGATLLVGDAFLPDGGIVRAYEQAGGQWTERTTLRPAAGHPNDYFGRALAFDGDTLVVGAHGDGQSGAAYVFVRRGNEWTEQATLLPPEPAGRQLFGVSVAVSGDRAVAAGAFATELYERTAGAWRPLRALQENGQALGRVGLGARTIVAGSRNDGSAFLYGP